MSLLYEDIREDIIGSAFEMYNILGYGFLEKGVTDQFWKRESRIQSFCLLKKSVFHQCESVAKYLS